MKKKIYLMYPLMICLLIFGSSAFNQVKSDKSSATFSFDEGWRFIKRQSSRALKILVLMIQAGGNLTFLMTGVLKTFRVRTGIILSDLLINLLLTK